MILEIQKVPEIYKSLIKAGLEIDIYDPLADPKLVEEEYGISLDTNS